MSTTWYELFIIAIINGAGVSIGSFLSTSIFLKRFANIIKKDKEE
jgi:hypothetical protein